MPGDIAVERSGYVAIVEVRRPPTNYFDHALLGGIADICEDLQAGAGCRAIVLASQGKHFCAGADFGSDALTGDRDEAAAQIYRAGIRLFRIELPIVAAVQGAAIGGGLGLACAADFRVASTRTRFHANFASLGFHHGFALSVTLPQIIGPQRAKELLITARRIDGSEALRWGLADRLVEPGDERAGALALAKEIAVAGPLAVRSIKQTLVGDVVKRVDAALRRELAEQSWLWRTPDSRARIAASLAPRETRGSGA